MLWLYWPGGGQNFFIKIKLEGLPHFVIAIHKNKKFQPLDQVFYVDTS